MTTVNRLGRVRTANAQKVVQQTHHDRTVSHLRRKEAWARYSKGLERSDAERTERQGLVAHFPKGREARYKESQRRVGRIVGHDLKLGIVLIKYRPGARILSYHPNSIELIPA